MLSWQPLLFFFSFPYLLDSMAFKVARGGSPEDIGSSMLGSYPTAQATVEDSAGECEKYCKPASEGIRHSHEGTRAQGHPTQPRGHPQGDVPTIHECPAMREGRTPSRIIVKEAEVEHSSTRNVIRLKVLQGRGGQLRSSWRDEHLLKRHVASLSPCSLKCFCAKLCACSSDC